MAKAVFGIAKSESQAIAIADQLRAAGFSENDIFVLLPRQAGDQGFRARATYESSRRRDGRRNCRRGSGRCVGWMTGIGALAIPGLGPLSRQVQ